MSAWFESRLRLPEPSGPPASVRRFVPTDTPLSQECVAVPGEGWSVVGHAQGAVRLFEVPSLQAEHCMLTFRASLRSEGLDGRAFLEMWVRLPGKGEFFSRGLNQPVRGTTDWVSCETPFHLKKGQKADLAKLNLVVEGRGSVWIKEIELLSTRL
jgi:hypothetical protein